MVDGYAFYSCAECESLFIEPEVLVAMDCGESPREYDEHYWRKELAAARARSRGDGLVRAGEAILYARRQVRRFLDVGAGPGYLLDEMAAAFPDQAGLFHAVELFPPEDRSRHPNYVVGDIASLAGTFDAGVCIEVIEHLTPRMLAGLIEALALVSTPDSLWLFNTGMPDYVRGQDPDYLDPRIRGHVVSYGLPALHKLFGSHGFRVSGLPGKSFAFVAEYRPSNEAIPFDQRFYAPVPENLHLLRASPLLYLAAFEAARSYYYQDESRRRAQWALSLDAQLQVLRTRLQEAERALADTRRGI